MLTSNLGKRIGVLGATAVLLLGASGCASLTMAASSPKAPDAGDIPTTAGTVDFCDWFPQSQLPPNPKPAPAPYGNPSDPASFTKLADDVTGTFATQLSQKGQYCSSGQTDKNGPIDPALCNKMYWGFQYTNDPIQRMCNFL